MKRYLQVIEVRECQECKGTGTVLQALTDDAFIPMETTVCMTCDGIGGIEQERRIGSLLDLHNLLCDIRRENDRAAAAARKDTVM